MFSQIINQTLEGSFAAVSTPIFATKYSFFSVLRDLEDLQSFAPLQFQNFRKKSQLFFQIFRKFWKIRMVRSVANRIFQLSGEPMAAAEVDVAASRLKDAIAAPDRIVRIFQKSAIFQIWFDEHVAIFLENSEFAKLERCKGLQIL